MVVDRWLSSTCAYQGFAGGFGVDKVVGIAQGALERAWPDVTIILDVDLKTAAGRLNRPLDRMEQKGDSYHREGSGGFLTLAKGRKDLRRDRRLRRSEMSVTQAGSRFDVVERHFLSR